MFRKFGTNEENEFKYFSLTLCDVCLKMYCYTLIFMLLFFNPLIFGLAKY